MRCGRRRRRRPAPGPVLVPFAGAEHDWAAIELGAWLAGSWKVTLKIAGPAVEGGRDSSRLLASASLAVQRALGVAAEPLLLEAAPPHSSTPHATPRSSVVGLSDRWRKDGLGPTRSALAAHGRPALLVRKGLRPGRPRAGREPDAVHVVDPRPDQRAHGGGVRFTQAGVVLLGGGSVGLK